MAQSFAAYTSPVSTKRKYTLAPKPNTQKPRRVEEKHEKSLSWPSLNQLIGKTQLGKSVYFLSYDSVICQIGFHIVSHQLTLVLPLNIALCRMDNIYNIP